MFISPAEALAILEHYKYIVIFPLTIIEGPILMIISGFLVYLGFLNGTVAFIVLVIADTIGDSLYYLMGRYWRSSERIKRYASFLGYNENSEVFLEDHFRKHKIKTFLIAKVAHGVGGSVQVAAGIARVNYLEFLLISFLGTIPKTSALMIIGFYMGKSYVQIDGYLHYVALVTIGLSVLLAFYFVSKKFKKDLLKKEVLNFEPDKKDI